MDRGLGMRKIVTIQWLRAVASIMVVWIHAMYVIQTKGIDSFQTSAAYLHRFGACGVDIFFVISGFIVTLSAARYPSPAKFIIERVLRVWPLYVIATLAFLVV